MNHERHERHEKVGKGLVPRLRFPEFRDKPEWEERAGDSLFDQINDRNPKSELPVLAITQEHGAIPRDMIDYHVTVTEKSIKSYKVVREGDFIISLRSFQGGIEYSHYHGICSPAYVILRRNAEGSDTYFKHYLKTDRFIRALTRNLEGLRDGKMISYRQFSQLLLPVPPPAEQQKIAECLGSLDGLIAAEGWKLAALRDHKCGLMQQLFPQPGQTQPRLRFPEFMDKGEWEEKPLVELAKFTSGGTPSKIDPKLWNGDIPWISASAMHDTVVYDSELKVTQEAIGNGTRLASKGSILILVRGSMLFKRVPICIAERDVAFNQDVKSILPKRGVVTRYLLYHLIASESRIAINATGIGAGKIDTEHLKSLIIGVPSSTEQQRIADCLTAIDAQISAQAAKIDALKQHKRGLMQQLFPAPEAGES